MSRLTRVLNRLFGPSPTSDQHYECACGTAMTIIADVPYDEYRVETWRCTDDACLRGGHAYLFEQDGESYGDGVLAGQVDS
jgi:hypothetical protein